MRTLDSARAKRVIVELIRAAGGSLKGKTRLYKAFYLAHLFYAEKAPDYLTNWQIVRMPNGPGIDSGDELLNELVISGAVTRHRTKTGPYPTTTYRLTSKVAVGEPLSKQAIEAIRAAVKFVQSKSATELSDLTHEYSRSWIEGRDGQPLNVYIDSIDDDEFSERERDLDSLNRDLLAAWTSK